MAEKRYVLRRTPVVRDAIALYGFICPIVKMLPYDVYLRVDLGDTGLILETEKHYFDDSYYLSPKAGPATSPDADEEYVASLTGSRSYPVDAGSMLRSRKQLEESGYLRKPAVRCFMSRYSKSAIIRSTFDSDVRWEGTSEGLTVLIVSSSSEGDLKRLVKRLRAQFDMEEVRLAADAG